MSKYIGNHPHSLPVATNLVGSLADMAEPDDHHRDIVADNRPVIFTISTWTDPESTQKDIDLRTRSTVLLLRSLLMVTIVFDKFTHA
jgi:hypothetical protein